MYRQLRILPSRTSKKFIQKQKKVLRLEDYKNYLDKVLKEVHIHWTGYSEPCIIKEMGKFIEYTHIKGHKQTISTTLCGDEGSVESVAEFKNFESFTLRLPDYNGLMEGIKNTDQYIERFKNIFRRYVKTIKASSIYLHLE